MKASIRLAARGVLTALALALCLPDPARAQVAPAPDAIPLKVFDVADGVDPASLPPDLRAPAAGERVLLDAAKVIATGHKRDVGMRADIPALRLAVPASEASYGPSHPFTALVLAALGDALYESGQQAESEPLHRRAMEIYCGRYGEQHQMCGAVRYTLIQHLIESHHYNEAERIQRAEMARREKIVAPDSLDVAVDLQTLASILVDTGRAADAVPMLERASGIIDKVLGADEPMAVGGVLQWARTLEDAGRRPEAIALLRRVLAAREASLGKDHVQVVRLVVSLARTLRHERLEAESEQLYRRALASAETNKAIEAGFASQMMAALAALLYDQGRYAETEAIDRRMLALDEDRLGANHPEIAEDLGLVADAVESQGRYAEAEGLRRRQLSIYEAANGPESAPVLAALGQLAGNLESQSRPQEGVALARRMLAGSEKTFGPSQADTANAHDTLAIALEGAGQNEEAEAEYQRAIAIYEAADGPTADTTLGAVANLASFYRDQDRLADAERLNRRVLAGEESSLGADHPSTGAALSSLAAVLADQGRYAEAEPLYRRALAIIEARLGSEHVDTAQAVADVAFVLAAQQRWAEAEPLDRRALAVRKARLGADDPATLASMSNVAGDVARLGGSMQEAEALFRGAVEGAERRFPKGDSQTALYLGNLGWLLDRLGRYAEAEALHRRSLAMRESSTGPDSSDVAWSLKNLALVLDHEGRHQEAEAARRRAIAIREKRLGPNHPLVAQTLGELAAAISDQGRAREAEPLARRALGIARQQREREAAAADAATSARSAGDPVDPARDIYAGYLPIAWQANAADPALRDEAFRAAQDLDVSGAARALAQAAARLAAGACVEGVPGEDCLATLVRKQQDLAAQLRDDDRALLAATAKGDAAKAATLRASVEAKSKQLTAVQSRLRERFPDYATLVSPRALAIAQAQSRLHADEGLLFILPAGKDVFAFGLGPKQARWQRIEGGVERIAAGVARLRCQADPATCGGGEAGTRGVVSVFGQSTAQGQKPFDRDTAHALYAELVAPVEPAFASAKKLYVVASGPLGGLPLGVLVTQAPLAGEDDADPQVLERTPWLADRYALTTLPAVASLRALAHEAPSAAAQSFLGFGDPVLLGGGPAPSRGATPKWFRSAGDAQGLTLADPSTLRTQMAPLPGTRVELAAMADALHAPADALHLGAEATETAVKTSSALSGARVIAFATHGLLPQEVRGLDEPGLVFTPPDKATPEDDGVLAASEAATLDLHADWLILSACNTAAADGKAGGDSLSGLARAFLYAGARAMLVSHWRVRDDVTAVLTVETLRNRGKGSRAQSLQQAMHAVRTGKLSDGSPVPGWTPGWAHPSAWAPFVVVSDQDQ